MSMIDVGIIGASGYTGLELIRLLLNHPKVNISILTSRSYRDVEIADAFPHLKSVIKLSYRDVDTKMIADDSDVVFIAVPHGTAMKYVPDLMNSTRVIDLSADYRLEPKVYEKVYDRKHTDPRYDAVYGLTELHTEVKDAILVANPGCYPVGAILAVAPLVSESLAEQIVFDSKSGISGAGIEPRERTHFVNVAENVRAYEVISHRHAPEIVQELGLDESKISFTPHVVPCTRGILTTAHVFVSHPRTYEDISNLYRDFYAKHRFVRISDSVPTLQQVRASNFCDIGFELGNNRIVVISAIDNLIKGASGQAIQNMNVMFGLDETTGLWSPGLYL